MRNNIAKPYDKFEFNKNIIFLYFYDHKNIKSLQFTSTSKGENFIVLHCIINTKPYVNKHIVTP